MFNKKYILIVSLLLIVSFASAKIYIMDGLEEDIVSTPVNIVSPLEDNGGIPVNIQDQTTAPFAVMINQILDDTISLNQSPTLNTYNIILNTGHGVVVGEKIAIVEQNGIPHLFFAQILAVNTNNITLDTPVPYEFIVGNAAVFTYNDEMNVDGSSSTITYKITNFFSDSVDITRIIFHCLDTVEMDDAKFCSISNGLTRGIVFRKNLLNGNYINYWNIKSNGGWAKLAYDVNYDDKAKQGSFGFGSRLTYGGQAKHGVVIRLAPLESIEVLIQDDLTSIDNISITVEGHFVQN